MMWYEVVQHGECRGGREIDRHAKDGGYFAANAVAKVRKNREEAYYTPWNEDGEALQGLIGLKIQFSVVPGGNDDRPSCRAGRVQVLRLRATRSWRSAQDWRSFFWKVWTGQAALHFHSGPFNFSRAFSTR
jgi:hypothetical protein